MEMRIIKMTNQTEYKRYTRSLGNCVRINTKSKSLTKVCEMCIMIDEKITS